MKKMKKTLHGPDGGGQYVPVWAGISEDETFSD